MVFDTHFRRVMAASFAAFIVAAAAAAFAAGFTTALSRSLDDPRSAPALRIGALQTLGEALGPQGFLSAYARGNTGQFQPLVTMADEAIETFRTASLSEADRDRAAELRDGAAVFRNAARGPVKPELAALERAFADLASLMKSGADAAKKAQIGGLSAALVISELLMVLALFALGHVLLAAALYIRARMNRPAVQLRSSINGAAAGAMQEPIWGIGRRDEFGGIARAAERLRQAAVTARKDEAPIRAASPAPAPAPAEFATEAREALERASSQSHSVLIALTEAVERLTEAAKSLEQGQSAPRQERAAAPPKEARILSAPGRFAGAVRNSVVDDLLADLNALDRFARERPEPAAKPVETTITSNGGAVKLNTVRERLLDPAGELKLRASR